MCTSYTQSNNVRFRATEFKEENWKSKSAKFATSAKDATISGATGLKNVTVKTGKQLQERDWSREKQGLANAGTATKGYAPNCLRRILSAPCNTNNDRNAR